MQRTPTAIQQDNIPFAIIMVFIGITFIAGNDLATKWVSSDISIWQLLFMRSLFGILVLVPSLLLIKRLADIQPIHLKHVLARSAVMGVCYLLFFTALAILPVATVAGAFFSAPLFIVILSATLLREPVGIWLISSIILGFIGVLMVLQPDADTLTIYMILPVMAGFFYALTQIYTRKYCKRENPMALSFWLAVSFLALGAMGMLMVTLLPTPEIPDFLSYPATITNLDNTLIMIGIAIASLVTHFSLGAAYQNAPASLIGSLEYFYLPIAIIGGYWFFGERPNDLALLGIAVIILSGLIIAWREHRA